MKKFSPYKKGKVPSEKHQKNSQYCAFLADFRIVEMTIPCPTIQRPESEEWVEKFTC